MRTLLCALVLVASTILVSASRMDTVYKWKYVDYVWESRADRERAISTGDYNYTQVIPMDVDKAPDGRVFVSFVGSKGVPAVLATISKHEGPEGPLVEPYPNWSYFNKGDCDSIKNVYRIAIDECERLWVLDTGFLEDEPMVCEPQLLVFNLKDDSLMKRIIIPREYAVGTNNKTLLATPIVETSGRRCQDTTVYIADVYGEGIVIWNNGKLSRLESPVFGPSEGAANLTSGDLSINWEAGIVTMDLSPEVIPGEGRFLYFHALSSFDLYGAGAGLLKRSTNESDAYYFGAKNFLSSQAVGMVFSSQGTLFMGMTKESGIACWNRYRKMKTANVDMVTRDNERLQYINGMKTVKNYYTGEEELWVLSNRLVAFENKKLNFREYNYYILKKSVKDLVADTECELPYEIIRQLQPKKEHKPSSGNHHNPNHRPNHHPNHHHSNPHFDPWRPHGNHHQRPNQHHGQFHPKQYSEKFNLQRFENQLNQFKQKYHLNSFDRYPSQEGYIAGRYPFTIGTSPTSNFMQKNTFQV